VLTNVDGLFVGDILGERCGGMRTVAEIKPIFTAEVTPVKSADKRRFQEAMAEMDLEDKNLNITVNNAVATIHLFGEIQKEFIKTLLSDKYGIETEFTPTKTIYKEAPLTVARAGEGSDLVGFRVEPLPKGSGVQYVFDRAVGHTGGLTQSRLDAVEKAALAGLVPGALIVVEGGETVPFRPGVYGWEVTDIRVTFDYCMLPPGQQQPTPGVFHGETPYMLRRAIRNAGVQLLEPIYVYEIVVHAELCGKITNVISAHHGGITSIGERGVHVRINGKLPARSSQEFLIEFQSLTRNMGSFDIVQIEYEAVKEGTGGGVNYRAGA
jgi:ribosomal protection tetracycline resistance protein